MRLAATVAPTLWNLGLLQSVRVIFKSDIAFTGHRNCKGMDPMNEDGHLDWGTASQHTDLLEDLDALVDPETQRIIDEADLLEYVRLPLPPCVI